MKKTLLSLACAAAGMLSLGVQAQTVLTTSSWLPPTHTTSMAQKEWCDLLETNTQGRVILFGPCWWCGWGGANWRR